MSVKTKAALTTLSLNVLLTALKFLLFFFSGSLAVLAEAWHSFSDIATSFLVFLAVRGEERPDARKGEGAGEGGTKAGGRLSLEQAAALAIGLFLLVVALSLMVKFLTLTPRPVLNPLVAGLVFIGFAVGSFLVYRFETAVGKEHDSLGLLADGMHARTDMMISLITGFSLILYHLGFNLDRPVAGIIALVVLSFAVETLVNVSLSIARREQDVLFRYTTFTLVTRGLSPSAWRRAGEYLDTRLRVRFFGRPAVRRAPGLVARLLLVLLGLWWLSTVRFTVGPSEQAVVERFGRPLGVETPLGPGLHFKAPWPVDRVRKVDTEAVRTMNIGNTPDPETFALLWTRAHGASRSFISGENNYFYPYLVVNWKVKDLREFLYGHTSPERTLENLAYQEASKCFASRTFNELALAFRRRTVREMARRIQEGADALGTGIEVLDVFMIDIHPPQQVSDAFETVIASYQEKERMINEAEGYRNRKLPEARGEAARTREGAEGYAVEKPLRAEGEAEKFLARIPGDPRTRRITMKRIYLSTLAEALAGRNLILVDPSVGEPELWLGTERLLGDGAGPLRKAEF